MHLRLPYLLLLIMLLSTTPGSVAASRSAEPLCFTNTAGIEDCIDGLFRDYWQRNGGLSVFGYPLSAVLPEETPDGLQTVQHFERSRLELHPDAPAPYKVQLGRLGADRLQQIGRSPAPSGVEQDGCLFFVETGHNVCGRFAQYWEAHGLELGDNGVSRRESLTLLGLPLTEAALEVNGAGDRVMTQWFERARLELHGEGQAAQILQGLLDQEFEAGSTPPPPMAGFVEVEGDQLIQQGQPVFLKGTNYYPAAHPWGRMWKEWDGPTIERDLARLRRELGGNVVRALVPYSRREGWTDDEGTVSLAMLDRLKQFVQIAGQHQLKVIVTLFDWHDGVAPVGSLTESYELQYLHTIVSAFKDDDRVLAWDLHNEPDNYPAWLAGQQAEAVDWLGRMADAVHALDDRHPVTVGVGNYESLWHTAPSGRTIESFSDIVSVHNYDAAQFVPMVTSIRERTAKPVLLEEFGWPTGPECHAAYYDEPSQLYLYRQAMASDTRSHLVGLLNWWLQDIPAVLPNVADENGFFGLYRRDGQPKPAVGPFRAVRVPALPSVATSALPLTIVPIPQLPERDRPIVFDDGLVIRDSFMYFWRFFGGEAIFGRPITLAYRDASGHLVQYFQRARFELNEDLHVQPIDPDWPEGQTPEVYLDRVHLTPLGEQLLGDRTFPRVPDPNRSDTRYFLETGHTLQGAFLQFWETRGEIFFGSPLSEVIEEVHDGQQVRVQYFKYWRFEQKGDGPVQLGTLGDEALRVRQCPGPS